MPLITQNNIDFKRVSKNLKIELEKLNLDLSHSATLNLAARALGYENYNTLKPLLNSEEYFESKNESAIPSQVTLKETITEIVEMNKHLVHDKSNRLTHLAIRFICRTFEMVQDCYFDKIFFEKEKEGFLSFLSKKIITIEIKAQSVKKEDTTIINKILEARNVFIKNLEKNYRRNIKKSIETKDFNVKSVIVGISETLGNFIYTIESLYCSTPDNELRDSALLEGLYKLSESLGNEKNDVSRHRYETIKDGIYRIDRHNYIDRRGIHNTLYSKKFFEESISIPPEELIKAQKFIKHLYPLKNITTKITSYGLKHLAEEYLRKTSHISNQSQAYIGNGSFILAMIQKGFDIKRNDEGINAYFNISYPKAKLINEEI